MPSSIQFSADGNVFSMDGDVLNKAVRPANAAPDSRSAGRAIAINRSDFASFQQPQALSKAQAPPASSSDRMMDW